MKRNTVLKAVASAGLAFTLLAGCGSKQPGEAGTPGTTPPGAASLSPASRTAMEAQQQKESADRAAHAPPPASH